MEPLEILLVSLFAVSGALYVAIRLFRWVPITRLAEDAGEGTRSLRVRNTRGFKAGEVVVLTRRRLRVRTSVLNVTADGTMQLQEALPRAFAKGARVARASELLETVDTLFIALCLAFFIKTFFIQAFKIPSGSMKNTLLIGDHLLVAKFLYGTKIPFTDVVILPVRAPHRNEILVFQFPGENKRDAHYGTDFIKRCIGTPGDRVEMRDKTIYVNDVAQEETFTRHADPRVFPRFPNGDPCNGQAYSDPGHVGPATTPGSSRDNWGPITIPAETLLMLGDNRDESFDGRCWGFLPTRRIRGKALLIYFPLTRIRLIHTPPAL